MASSCCRTVSSCARSISKRTSLLASDESCKYQERHSGREAASQAVLTHTHARTHSTHTLHTAQHSMLHTARSRALLNAITTSSTYVGSFFADRELDDGSRLRGAEIDLGVTLGLGLEIDTPRKVQQVVAPVRLLAQVLDDLPRAQRVSLHAFLSS